jgi:glycosyltransferase involved in cell wall biosynthesis
MPDPLISIVIPTRDRPIRLRWLLNALADQTLSIDGFEVVVANGSRKPETSDLLRQHRLTQAGVLLELRTGDALLPAQRDLAWRATKAPLVVFTDDDCRPALDWLERALEAAGRSPGAVIQGTTLPDPDEVETLHHAPHARTQHIVPPTIWAQTCNILYPRRVLETVNGFDTSWPANFAGDDTDVALRAIRAGAAFRAGPEMLTYHAVHDGTLVDRIKSGWRWGDLPHLVHRHPQLRRHLPGRYFWKPSHALMTLALTGVVARARRPVALLLALPWALESAPNYSGSLRGRVRSVLELPSHAVIDLAEMTALLRGSVKHRTLLL